MRLLVLYQGGTISDQPGYHDGFLQLRSEGVLDDYRAIPYRGFSKLHGWPAMWNEAASQIREMDADVVFLQFFHDKAIPDPSEGISLLRSCRSRPMIFTSLGDGFGTWMRPAPTSYRVAACMADINFLTSMGPLARSLTLAGAKNLVLMPHGFCQVRFSSSLNRESYNPDFDVVLIGSRVRARWLIGSSTYSGYWRDRQVAALSKHYGKRFGLFGKGWDGQPCWQGPISYTEQHQVIRRARVHVGAYPGSRNDYYASDREFIALASGVPFVDFQVPGMDCLFKHGEDMWFWKSRSEMTKLVDQLLLLSETELLDRGERTHQRASVEHSQYRRCEQMLQIIRQYRAQKATGQLVTPPSLPFIRCIAPREDHVGPAVVNWQG